MNTKKEIFQKNKHVILPALIIVFVAVTLIFHRGNINGEIPVDLPDTPAVGVIGHETCGGQDVES